MSRTHGEHVRRTPAALKATHALTWNFNSGCLSRKSSIAAKWPRGGTTFGWPSVRTSIAFVRPE